MQYTLYGIPNCDTVKKTKKALEARGVEFEFIDFKKAPPTKELLKRWGEFLGELPVNKRGTTFRALKAAWEEGSEASRLKLLSENPSAVKRPILEARGKVLMMGHEPEVIEKLKT